VSQLRNRASRSRALASLLLVAGLALGASSCLNSPLEPSPQVRGIRLDTELAARRALAVSRLQRLRDVVAGWPGPVAEPAVQAGVRRAVLELRDAAAFTLEQERVVAARKFDTDDRLREFLEILYQETEELLALGERLMQASPPPSLSCRTDISGEPEDATLHYMAYGDYVADLPDDTKEWRSYTRGALLDIGIYQFRVTPPDEVAYYEKVLIVSDPFESRLKRLRP
jgi:hypothetical protein